MIGANVGETVGETVGESETQESTQSVQHTSVIQNPGSHVSEPSTRPSPHRLSGIVAAELRQVKSLSSKVDRLATDTDDHGTLPPALGQEVLDITSQEVSVCSKPKL